MSGDSGPELAREVIRLTALDERAGTQVAAALQEMAHRQASGLLEIDGNPAGAVYFQQGEITFAQASWVPDLGTRLLSTSRPGTEPAGALVAEDRPDHDIGTMLVERKILSRTDLQTLLHSIVVDAIIALTVPAEEDAFVSDVRFANATAHWAADFSSLRLDSIQAEACGKAEDLARYGVRRTSLVRLQDLSRPSIVLSREQWAIACAIDGTVSVQDAAWRCGLALYDAVRHVGALVQAGICVAYPADDSPLTRWFGAAAAEVPATSPQGMPSPSTVPYMGAGRFTVVDPYAQAVRQAGAEPYPRADRYPGAVRYPGAEQQPGAERQPGADPHAHAAPDRRDIPDQQAVPEQRAVPESQVWTISQAAQEPEAMPGGGSAAQQEFLLPHRRPQAHFARTGPLMSGAETIEMTSPPEDEVRPGPELLHRVLAGLRRMG